LTGITFSLSFFMSSKLIPINIPVYRQPGAISRKIVEARPFKKVWPKILHYMIAHPESTSKKLWDKFASRLDDVFSLGQFRSLLNSNGMTPGKVKTQTSTKEQVAIAISSFAEVKKDRANAFMNRISKKLDEIHDVVDTKKVTRKNVGDMLDLVSKLHKEGRVAYDIDDQHQVDKKTTNIAVLIGYEPKVKTVKTIDV
jgi:hypothetical protein